jgi:hypothetical protein
MSDLVRITPHPADREVVILRCSPELNSAMGTFQPARMAQDLGGYILLGEHVAQLYRWARFHEVHVVDERKTDGHRSRGPARPPVECRDCAQPGCLTRQPKMCPSCGGDWVPVPPPVRAAPFTSTECPSCGHKQRGRFPFCGRCGADLPVAPTVVAVRRFAPEPGRERLDEPIPLGRAVEDLTWDRATRVPRRPVVDVHLPEPEPDDEPDYCNSPHPDSPVGSAEPEPDPEPEPFDPWAIPEASKPKPPADLASEGQLTALHILFGEAGLTDRDDKLGYCTAILDRPVDSTKTLTRREIGYVRDALRQIVNRERLAEHRRTGQAP